MGWASFKMLVVGSFLLASSWLSAADITVTTTADSGPGSFRQAIADSVRGDRIVFDSGLTAQTISLLSPISPFIENLTIDSTAAPALTIAGATLSPVGSGRLTLLGDTTYTATTITVATVIGPAADVTIVGNVTGNMTVNGEVQLGAGSTLSGDLDVSSSGIAVIDGTITGDVDVDGNLQLDAAGVITGTTTIGSNAQATIAGTLNGNANVDSAANATIDGIVNGNLSVDGNLVLNTTGTVSGNALIETGAAVQIDGTISGTTNVDSGATLVGSGNLTGNTSNRGMLDAGEQGVVGTLNFGNDLTNNSGTVVVDIDDVTNDQYLVAGDVTLNGGTVDVNVISTFTPGTPYTFLTAGGTITGSFTEAVDDYPFFDSVLNQTATSVSVTLTDAAASFAAIGESCNQTTIGGYLDAQRPGASGDLADVIDALRFSTTGSIQAGLDQLGGQIYPTLVSAQLQHTSFSMAMLRDQLLLDSLRHSPNQTRGWIRGYGIGGDADTDDCGTRGFNYRLGGTEIAVQRAFSSGLDLGVFTNLAWSDVATDGISQDADVDSYQFGGSAQYSGTAGYLLGIAGAGYQRYDVRRTLSLSGSDIHRVAASQFDGSQVFGMLEYGKIFQSGITSWMPHFAMQYAAVDQDNIHETGASSVNLIGNAIDADSLRSVLGLSVQQAGPTSIGPAITKLRLGWMHEYTDTHENFVAAFEEPTIDSTSMTVRGLDLGRDWAVVGVNLQWSFLQHATALFGYQGQVNDIQSLHTGAAGLEARW
ncbi:Extracellular serine protease precursor [Novipirellula artificiosorum]|uniref:Extracellular serine protease n=2 Tax=Novipirellula artificiosorum TaxID=2528016 RepID=A0A5C6DWY1_9BACT|nr:Extracellular serine protease precursor [Novipirellula artificiosorum]